ncbi:hypothetical protein [Mesorhizobium sp. 113-3-3]|uniref:hypothetical protein n=1 Tax=Mesorhizobium sp. 113-3-3 TaxID=2744516 RepID=UPI001938C7FA|nr:hypothetical protein [Mesorhizobium sp. 113-3-3]BCG83850.1 hypothetical protein MesoLj113b_73920 [Mesorhizobium sp. 113-3-3]
MGCLFLATVQASQHVTKAPTLDSGQPGIGKVGRVDRADEPFDCLEPVKRHFVAWDRSSHRFAWLRVAEKRQLRDELYAQAQRRKIAGRSKMTKQQLENALGIS